MKKTVYCKINKRRKIEFQLITKIIEDGKIRKVIKRGCNKLSEKHVRDINSFYDKNIELYKVIIPLKCELVDNAIVFPYIKGHNATTVINNEKNDIDRLCKKINYFLNNIIVYNESMYCDFEESEKFNNIFGASKGFTGKALKYADIDMIFDNLIEFDGKWYAYDYEWTMLFPVPVDFLKFRILYRYYCAELDYFNNKLSQSEFLSKFDISQEQAELFEQWEYSFLHYVYGKDFKYDYISNYQKENIDFQSLVSTYGNIEKAINERNESIWTYDKVKKELDKKILEQQNEIEKQQNEIDNKREKIISLKNELSNKNIELASMCEQYERLKSNTQKEMEKISKEYQSICIQNEELINSKIWRWSKPFRDVVDGIGKR